MEREDLKNGGSFGKIALGMGPGGLAAQYNRSGVSEKLTKLQIPNPSLRCAEHFGKCAMLKVRYPPDAPISEPAPATKGSYRVEHIDAVLPNSQLLVKRRCFSCEEPLDSPAVDVCGGKHNGIEGDRRTARMLKQRLRVLPSEDGNGVDRRGTDRGDLRDSANEIVRILYTAVPREASYLE